MLGQPGKGTIILKCTEQALPEFPNLLFGTQIDEGVSYFDATLYLHKQISFQKSIRDFFISYEAPIRSLCNAYDIAEEDVCKRNEEGHLLIDGNFVYLFISFVEPNFLAYMCDRTHELMTSGLAISDTYLLHSAKSRLSKEALKTIIEDDTNSKQ